MFILMSLIAISFITSFIRFGLIYFDSTSGVTVISIVFVVIIFCGLSALAQTTFADPGKVK